MHIKNYFLDVLISSSVRDLLFQVKKNNASRVDMMGGDDSFSCIKEVVKCIHIPLPSFYIGKEIKGVTEVLDSWKRQYKSELKGILVNYKNVSVKVDGSRSLVIDKPFARYFVTATFQLFCPNIGSIVKGKVNRISHDYIGCLIHNTINATIKRLKNPSEINKFVALENMILFKVTCFDFFRRAIRVKGEITEECVNLMKELPEFQMQSDIFENSSTCLSGSEFSEDTMNSDNVDKGSHKDVEMSPSLLSVDYSTLKNTDSASNLNTSNPSKEFSGSTTFFDTPSPSQDSSSSSENVNQIDKLLPALNKKKSKKRKLDEIDNAPSIEPQKKKKRKEKKSKEKSTKKEKNLSKDKKNTSKKKKSEKEELLKSNSLIVDNNMLQERITDGTSEEFSLKESDLTDTSSQVSSTKLPFVKEKKKKSKKSKKKESDKNAHEHQKNILSSDQNADMFDYGINAVTDALVKEELQTDSGFLSPSPTSKISKKSKNSFLAKDFSNNALQNTFNRDSLTDTSTQSLSSKKKKHKKLKDDSINASLKSTVSNISFPLNDKNDTFHVPNISKKKQKKSESPTSTKKNVSNSSILKKTMVKEEVQSDNDFKSINCVSQNDSNRYSPGKKNISVLNYENTDELIKAFSMYEPSLEEQLLLKESPTNIKEEVKETTKEKKRKRSSLDISKQPKKKKAEDGKSPTKNKDKLHKKNKKKDKEKSKTSTKKEEKKKLKSLSKRKSLEYKSSLKKKKKLKDGKCKKDKKKSKKDKSSHHETKHVPSDIAIKSENS